MEKPSHRLLKLTALAAAAAWLAWLAYGELSERESPGRSAYVTGVGLLETGDYHGALAAYELGLAHAPRAPYLVRAKARALAALGREEEALAWFERAVELQPHFGGTYAYRGMTYDRLGRYDMALADYEKALELDEEIGRSRHWLAGVPSAQVDGSPTLKGRLAHLKRQLARPEARRSLRPLGAPES